MSWIEMPSFWFEQCWKFLLIWVPLFAAWLNLRIEIKANRKASLEMFDLQERKNDARATIPVVIVILEDLANLQQAFVFRGKFIPGLEHRCPDIQLNDSEVENEMSVAERTQQLRLIARKMLNNCRRVIFLMPKNVMPETVKVCRSIRDAWTLKESGKKHAYEIKISAIGSILQNDCDHPGFSGDAQQQMQQSRQKNCDYEIKLCDAIAAELEKFHADLEACVEKEFPTYALEGSKEKS
ncbi:MAG: hypothetical protein JSR93_00135 [Verrucomicrobia bacterium]|nr:hypothetical protein [Verrucomicrobiota bacterium]